MPSYINNQTKFLPDRVESVVLTTRQKAICLAILRSLNKIGWELTDYVMRDPEMVRLRVTSAEVVKMITFMQFRDDEVIKQPTCTQPVLDRYRLRLIPYRTGPDVRKFLMMYKIPSP